MNPQKRPLQALSGLSAGAESGVDGIWRMQLRKEHGFLLARLENLEESMKRFEESDTTFRRELAERFILLEGQISKQKHELELIRQEYKERMEDDKAKMKEEFAADWKRTHSNASASTIAGDDEGKPRPATRARVQKLFEELDSGQQDQIQHTPVQQAPIQDTPIQSKRKLDKLSQGRASFSQYFASMAKKLGEIPADREVEFIGLFVIGMTSKEEREELGGYLCSNYRSRLLKNGVTEFDCYWTELRAAAEVTGLL
ncbi:hypothetical protein B7494_g5151 [Chlorociboria aeruginascens]|nr:hypothetical protein B7494_g5151 [Chlorociboria aeruginascens]